jgi:hypothetical protein
MRRSILVALLLAAGLVAGLALTSSAQVTDGTPCEQDCYERKAACVSDCGEERNPVECDQLCQEQVDECVEQCD